MQKIILNIGLNVDGVPAFTPAFALKSVGRFFNVEAHEVVTSSTEQTVVALVSAPEGGLAEIDTNGCIFELACRLNQQAIAYAYEANVEATGVLTGPEARLWDGGRFNRAYFISYEEAARKADRVLKGGN